MLETDPQVLADEERVQWIDGHPECYRYVREWTIRHAHRATRPRAGLCPGRMVAYAVLRPDAAASWPGSRFQRRVWWTAGHDPYEGGGAPCEAVDPCAIRPGQFSRPPREEVMPNAR